MSGRRRKKGNENQHSEYLLEYTLTGPCTFKGIDLSLFFFLTLGLTDVRIPHKTQAGFCCFDNVVILQDMGVPRGNAHGSSFLHASLSRENTGALLILGLDQIHAFHFFIVVKYA